MLQQFRSWRHAFSLWLSERLRGTKGPYREPPAGPLANLAHAEQQRIEGLVERYGVRFEESLCVQTALRNYEYLDLLDRAFGGGALPVPRPQVLCDAGCASFWYAAALVAFFKPGQLVGVDVEGYRRLRGGHTRIDYAHGYLAGVGQGEFVVADYRRYERPADLITAFFPFLLTPSILAWRLPTSLLDPVGLFAQIRCNLKANGLFLMVNHGQEEAQIAAGHCSATGLTLVSRLDEPGTLSTYRSRPAVTSLWRRS